MQANEKFEKLINKYLLQAKTDENNSEHQFIEVVEVVTISVWFVIGGLVLFDWLKWSRDELWLDSI